MIKRNLVALLVILACYFTITHAVQVPEKALQDFVEIVTDMGYPVETHNVQTTDGYILTYFRIQKKNTIIQTGLCPILFHHGLLDSADSAILNDESQAPGLILANAGYDVWFGNSRGNKYSLNHTDPVNYNSSQTNSKFWDFSWQEMSQYDVPAGLQYIATETGKAKVDYVGHSQGTLIMFAALARGDATVLKYLRKYIALAPVVFTYNTRSPLLTTSNVLQLGTILGIAGPLVQNKKFGFLTPEQRSAQSALCVVANPICVARLVLLGDSNTTVANTAVLPISTGHFPAGTSVQNFNYYQQMYNNRDKFKKYDYGAVKNTQVYGTRTAPEYNLGNIKMPIYMYCGLYDELATPTDTGILRDRLTGSSNVQYKLYPLGHSTFLLGLHVSDYMVDVIANLGQCDA